MNIKRKTHAFNARLMKNAEPFREAIESGDLKQAASLLGASSAVLAMVGTATASEGLDGSQFVDQIARKLAVVSDHVAQGSTELAIKAYVETLNAVPEILGLAAQHVDRGDNCQSCALVRMIGEAVAKLIG